MQGCGEGGCFNILVIVVPQICDGLVGTCAMADTISPSLKANLELVDQQSVGAACISIYFYTTQNVGFGGEACFNILLHIVFSVISQQGELLYCLRLS